MNKNHTVFKFSTIFPLLLCISVSPITSATEAKYIPRAIYCANDTSALCATMPSMIGQDPAVIPGVGYHGLPPSVDSFDQDSQTPFDNMAWQMFIAANWSANPSLNTAEALSGEGARVWQTWKRPQDVFGEEKSTCPNKSNLPRINIMSKAGGQPDARTDGILEASSNKPLIDRNGNWVLFERRLNPVEERFITRPRIDKNGNKSYVYTLKSVDGQKRYIKYLQEKKVAFQLPVGEDLVASNSSTNKANGNVGAIEMKTAWRILQVGEPTHKFFNMKALLEVSGDMVFSNQTICTEVTLGLIGMHIIQKNPKRGGLRDQWIWATFEHRDNAPLSTDPADPIDFASYGKYPNSNCPLSSPAKDKIYSLYNPGCTSCTNNAPPTLGTDKFYIWDSKEPYARHYLTKDKAGKSRYGTQVVQCAKSYDLTSIIDKQWHDKLTAINSVFANYNLVGTQWGADIEQTAPPFVQRNAVPDFLSNTTMETYLQTGTCEMEQGVCVRIKGAGSCVSCHNFATLAAKDDQGKSVKSDFSFLLGLAKNLEPGTKLESPTEATKKE